MDWREIMEFIIAEEGVPQRIGCEASYFGSYNEYAYKYPYGKICELGTQI